MAKILILFAHPALQKSRVNRVLIEGIGQLDGVTFHDLYQAYPELDIDVKFEQDLLGQHQVIVFQHPFFWYSAPAIFKEWQDLVLEHGWAYGSQGNALKDKLFFNIISTGGRTEAYTEHSYNHFTIRQLLAPIEQTANLCKMVFLPPFVVHGTHSISQDGVVAYRRQLFQLLALFRNDQVDIPAVRKLAYLNDYLKSE